MLSVFQKNNTFPMLAFDHRGSFVKLLTKNSVVPTLDEIIQVKEDIIRTCAPFVSGVLIDEDYGLPAFVRGGFTVPYILPLEQTGYTQEESERITTIFRTPEELREKGAQAAKLLLYTNPHVSSWKKQIDTARAQVRVCAEAQMPLFLEFVLYAAGDVQAGTVVENVRQAIQEGVVPTVWKIPYPGSVEACKEITALVGDVPWILLTGGTSFEVFAEQYKIAKESGAQGFLAGRALWQEVGALFKEEGYDTFMRDVLPARIKALTE